MQPQDQHTGTSGSLSHPDAAEWMAFLYGETAAPRRSELGDHLAHCPTCAALVKAWRASLRDLDAWVLPVPRPAARPWLPALRWAAAAAVMLGMGIWLGRQMSPSASEFATLRATVAELSATVRRNSDPDAATSVAAATTAANAETLRLLTQYSSLQDDQRAADQQALKLTLDTFDVRLSTLRNELETVAVNTEGGFQVTRQNLARLVSFDEPK